MKLKISLSQSGLKELEQQIEAVAKRLESVPETVVDELSIIAEDTAKVRVKHATGTLASSITTTKHRNHAVVSTNSPYATFVEFGTGIGRPSGDPLDSKAMAEMGYVIGASGHGEKGWNYFKDGEWVHTVGQNGAGYMAAGANEARQHIAETVKRALND